MKTILLSAICLLLSQALKPVAAQNQNPTSKVFKSDFGYTFSYPAAWTTVPNDAAPKAIVASDTWRLSECSKTELALHHASGPAVSVVVTATPYECIGRSLVEKDFPVFAVLESRMLKNIYDVNERGLAAHTLGTHPVWIERVAGSPKGHPESPATAELACTLLKKASVCWKAEARDAAALKEFEHCTVTLDGESAAALVPAAAAASLQKPKPSSTQRPDSAWTELQVAPTGNALLLKSPLGFTFDYPVAWDDITPILPVRFLKQQKDWAGKLGGQMLGCMRPMLFVQNGKPASTISVIAVPHACTNFRESTFFLGTAVGACSNDASRFDIKETLHGVYKLGDANFFIEHSVGTPKGEPNVNVTLERVCGWLKNTEVFWQGELRDEEAVNLFEGALTSVNGGEPTALVPESAKAALRKPSASATPAKLPAAKP